MQATAAISAVMPWALGISWSRNPAGEHSRRGLWSWHPLFLRESGASPACAAWAVRAGPLPGSARGRWGSAPCVTACVGLRSLPARFPSSLRCPVPPSPGAGEPGGVPAPRPGAVRSRGVQRGRAGTPRPPSAARGAALSRRLPRPQLAPCLGGSRPQPGFPGPVRGRRGSPRRGAGPGPALPSPPLLSSPLPSLTPRGGRPARPRRLLPVSGARAAPSAPSASALRSPAEGPRPAVSGCPQPPAASFPFFPFPSPPHLPSRPFPGSFSAVPAPRRGSGAEVRRLRSPSGLPAARAAARPAPRPRVLGGLRWFPPAAVSTGQAAPRIISASSSFRLSLSRSHKGWGAKQVQKHPFV